jgi:hypothetical protein
MRKHRTALPAADAKDHRRSAVDDPNLQELLDHLGRLIAKEYVALLRKSGPTQEDSPKKVNR